MAVALLVVVALAGMGLGFAADRLALHNERNGSRRAPPPSSFGGSFRGPGREAYRAQGMRERLAQELDLSPEQQRRVDSIMARQTEDFRRLQEAMRPRFDSLLVSAQARLDSVLTPAQRDKLKTLRSREVFGPRDSFGSRERRPPPF
jgi:Spy/CpxP family protein refolding chaperone